MSWMVQYTIFTIPLALVTLLAGIAAYFTWQKRDSMAEAWMTAVLVDVTLWALVHLLLYSAEPKWLKYLFASLAYPLGPYVSITLFMFAMYYTGRGHQLTTARRVLIFGPPLLLPPITLSEWWLAHGLAFQNVQYELSTAGKWVLEYEFGPALYLYVGLGHVFGIASLYLLYLKASRSRNVYRKLSFQTLLIAGTMEAANLVTFFGESPFRHMTLLPLSFLLFGITVVGTTISVRFIKLAPINLLLSKLGSLFADLVPLARDIVIEEIDSGVIVLDEDNYIVDVNAMGKRILAPDGDRIVGQKLTDVVSEELFVSEATELLEPGTTGRFESVWVEALDGTERCYDISFTGIKATETDDSGSRVGLIHDVTDKQRRKRELEAKNEKLDSFASMVSHDLRNPLNVAEGYVETIQAHVDEDDPVATYAEEVAISHQRMEEIIEDVLILAREGRSVEDMQSLELDALAETAWGNVETGAADFATRIDDDVTIEGNRSSVLRALENLIRNAIEHGQAEDASADEADPITVRIGTLSERTGFYVEDTGPGIPEDRREEVFEHGHTTNEDGTGFGLSIVQDIADAHDWEVAVTASPEGGARFEFDGVAIDRETASTDPTDQPANGD